VFLTIGLVHSGQVEAGVSQAERALTIAPDDGRIRYNVACAFARAGQVTCAGTGSAAVSTSLSASTLNLNFQPNISKLRPLSRNEIQKGLPRSSCAKAREISSTWC